MLESECEFCEVVRLADNPRYIDLPQLVMLHEVTHRLRGLSPPLLPDVFYKSLELMREIDRRKRGGIG